MSLTIKLDIKLLKKKILRGLLASIFLAIPLLIVFMCSVRFGKIPPLGSFFDPFAGFWRNAEGKSFSKEEHLSLKNLQGEVSVLYDEQMVPHIFADNEDDLYLVQGYVTAKDRLWQMDFQNRYAAGRLSEVMGPKALETDRYQRRIGMMYSAENIMRAMNKNPHMKRILERYAEGVNQYIHSLNYRTYPIEYKVFGYKPEKWKPINSALLLTMMSETLASRSEGFQMSNVLNRYGQKIIDELFGHLTRPRNKWIITYV